MTTLHSGTARRIIVTGASGFVGRHCIGPLRARGYEIHAVTSKLSPSPIADVTWHRLDLHDAAETEHLVDRLRASHLLHLAWSFGPGGADGAPTGSCPGHFQWTQTTLHLVRRFTEAGGSRALVAGSSQEYDWTSGLCSELTTPRRPANYYGTCKNALFEMLSGYAEHTDLSLAWARIFFLYGPHEPEARLIPLVIRNVLRGEPALCSHGSQIRDYLYVQDAAEALATILDSEFQGPINVASGEPIAIRDLVGRAAERLGRPDLIRLGALAPRPTDVSLLLADTSRLRAEVGWRPRVTLEQGLDQTIDFWRGQLVDGSRRLSS